MYSSGVLILLGSAILVWLLILSYIYYKDRKSLRELFPKGEGKDIRERFSEVISFMQETQKKDINLNKNLKEIYREGLGHIQRVALLRYNPYGDTGGNVSFSLALLDGRGTGVVITSLHTRAGTRVYTKEVVESKSDLQLSKEEIEVIKKANEQSI
jgi:hypothetical protein